MKKYLTLQEILALNIPDFPNSRQALDYKAKKEDWEYIEQIDERITAKISKEKFNDMFGPDAKPRKGDALSAQKRRKKFKIKKIKNKSKKKGKKNYTVELETVKN